MRRSLDVISLCLLTGAGLAPFVLSALLAHRARRMAGKAGLR